jgi:ketosteroid isomerase-like protein
MKKFLFTLALAIAFIQLSAQNQAIEAEIRKLEEMEVKAVLAKDSITLLKLWDTAFVVNAPDNAIYFAGKTTLDRPVMRVARTGFTRQVEQVIIRGSTVFSMGSEMVTPAGDQLNAAQTVTRRYTNVWMRRDNEWKLVARHANVICGQAAPGK